MNCVKQMILFFLLQIVEPNNSNSKPSVRRSWNAEGQLMIMMTLVMLLVMMMLVMMMLAMMMLMMMMLMMACTCPALHPIPSYVFPHFYLLP